jgi:hypothetical protein
MSAVGSPEGADAAFQRPSRVARAERRATRRRFLAGGLGTLAAGAAVALGNAAPASATTNPESPYSVPRYRSRRDWGCDESLSKEADGKRIWPVEFYPVQKITVHHTASYTPWGEDEAAELVRTIYHEHAVEQSFGDIGYHLLIDPDGIVYEGRHSGGTSFPIYDIHPSQASRPPRAVVGGHTFQYNVGNIGIAMLGDMDAGGCTDAAWWSLELVIAMIAANTGITADGKSVYSNPVTQVSADVPNICGHRHYAQTDCPGGAMMGWMKDLRAGVRSLAAEMPAGTWLA